MTIRKQKVPLSASLKLFLICSMTFFSTLSQAETLPEFQITPLEKLTHQQNIDHLMKVSSSCIKADYDHHVKFYSQYRISAFYGDRSDFAKKSRVEQKAVLRSLHLNDSLLDQLQPTSCVGLTLKCLEKGFLATNQSQVWSRIKKIVRENGQDGTILQIALRDLGWSTYYWNPLPGKNAAWDTMEKTNDPQNKMRLWGYHSYRHSTVQNKGLYYHNKIDNKTALVNFNESTPAFFKKVPFFIGTAHGGYHVFPGAYGQVIEGHSTRSITDSHTLETSPFNPLANGGGPRGSYFSGIMSIPPTYGLE